MTHPKRIDTETWARKQQFAFFKTFAQPFFNITANVDVTALTHHCKTHSLSFSLCALHASQTTVNGIPELRYRLKKGEVWEYDEVHLGVTIMLEDQTFIYCTIMYHPDLATFITEAQKAIETQKKAGTFTPHTRPDMVYYSIIPWISFTGFGHASDPHPDDSTPRIVFGKYFQEADRFKMPVSIELHHALADGYHMGQYFETFQAQLNLAKNTTR